MSIKKYLQKKRQEVDDFLDKNLPSSETEPQKLHEAMRYSIFAGGKRLRPILCLATAEMCRSLDKTADQNSHLSATAIECLHTYSLIHDDLPSMDDDDLRRGQPSCHKKFGEAVAILAGDALNTLAFSFLAKIKLPADSPYTLADFVNELAFAAGSQQLIGGQVLDLQAENTDNENLTQEDLVKIHMRKTSAMITSSILLGGMSVSVDKKLLPNLLTFGKNLGLAFQVIDDILDVSQTEEALGKTSGKDAKAGKLTYPALIGLCGAHHEAERLSQNAKNALKPFSREKNKTLMELADYMLTRKN